MHLQLIIALSLLLGACQSPKPSPTAPSVNNSSTPSEPVANPTARKDTVAATSPTIITPTLPIGMLSYQSEGARNWNDTLRIYNADGTLYNSIFRDQESLEWEQEGLSIPQGDQVVRALFFDYDILVFDVLSRDEATNTFEIKIGEEIKTARVSGTYFQYQTLEDFVKNVDVGLSESTALRKEAQADAEVGNDYAPNFYTVQSVEGNWLQVTCLKDCEGGCPDNSSRGGWVQWKNETEIMVSFYYIC